MHACRADPNVLWVTYEDMVADLPACVELVAKFMFGPSFADQAVLNTAVQQSSLAAMKQVGHLRCCRSNVYTRCIFACLLAGKPH